MWNTLASSNVPPWNNQRAELLVYSTSLVQKKYKIDNHQKCHLQKKKTIRSKTQKGTNKKPIPVRNGTKKNASSNLFTKKANELPEAPPTISGGPGTLQPPAPPIPKPTGPTLWWRKVSAFATGDACTTSWRTSRRQGRLPGGKRHPKTMGKTHGKTTTTQKVSYS